MLNPKPKSMTGPVPHGPTTRRISAKNTLCMVPRQIPNSVERWKRGQNLRSRLPVVMIRQHGRDYANATMSKHHHYENERECGSPALGAE